MQIGPLLRGTVTAVAAMLLAACHPAAAAGEKGGQPDAELAACLKAQAWEIRGLNIPAQSAVSGIIAQCEIRVDQLNGGPPADQSAREPAANQVATAAVAQYRQCPAK